MNKGDTVKGPAFIRRRYKDEWEYAFLHPGGTFSPFGKTPPSAVKWVYQVTWKDVLQRIHRITEADRELGFSPLKESGCWWIMRAGNLGEPFEIAWAKHAEKYKA